MKLLGNIKKSIPALVAFRMSVTFCMKMRPLSCILGFPFLSTSGREDILFFGLLRSMSLQQSNMDSKK